MFIRIMKMNLWLNIRKLYSVNYLQIFQQLVIFVSIIKLNIIAPLAEILSVEVVCEDRPDGPIKLDLKEVI